MRALAATWSNRGREAADEPRPVTLLELVQAVSDVATNEREVVATVLHMLRSGRVRLTGCFRDDPLDSFYN